MLSNKEMKYKKFFTSLIFGDFKCLYHKENNHLQNPLFSLFFLKNHWNLYKTFPCSCLGQNFTFLVKLSTPLKFSNYIEWYILPAISLQGTGRHYSRVQLLELELVATYMFWTKQKNQTKSNQSNKKTCGYLKKGWHLFRRQFCWQ